MVDTDVEDSLKLHRQAIDAALCCNWDQALKLNMQIIEEDPDNVECLNRLAKAYFELGNYTSSKKFYEQVLDIDPYNSIAQKNLKKIQSIKKTDNFNGANQIKSNGIISPHLFIEEAGITKSVTLIKVAEPQKLLTLSAGQMVNLILKNRGISVVNPTNQYLGVLPDDIAYHLLRLIKGGNKYQAIIKSVKPNGLTIIIREVFRSKKFRNQASFLNEAKVLSLSSDNIALLNSEPSVVEADDVDVADDSS